jgi:hypothetical protein
MVVRVETQPMERRKEKSANGIKEDKTKARF